MALSTERKGELYIFFETLLWSFFPIVTILTLKQIGPLFSFAISSVFALLFFAGVLTVKKRWYELRIKEAQQDILLSSFFIMLLFIFFFLGLQYTTASNGAIIMFLQILFSFLFFNVLKREYIAKTQILGAVLMGAGAMMILFQGEVEFNKGDLLILLAALTAPVANNYQRRTRSVVGSETLLFVRTLIASPVLFALAFIFNDTPTLPQLEKIWVLLLINGFVLLGLSKIFWVEAIHRISVTKAAAMTALGPLYTMIFAYYILGEVPTAYQLLGVIPVVIGGTLVVKKVRRQVR